MTPLRWLLLSLPLLLSVAAADRGPNLPTTVDLRPRFEKWRLLPRSQGARNTCSVLTTASALEFALSKRRGEGTLLSPEYLNWACNQVIGNKSDDRGQFFHDLLKGYERFGICTEKEMPYQLRFDPALAPAPSAAREAESLRKSDLRRLRIRWINPWKPEAGLTEAQFLSIRSVLSRGYPVAAGSGHSRLLVGYRDDATQPGGGVFLAKDSGAGAFTEVSYEFVKTKVGDVFWVEALHGK